MSQRIEQLIAAEQERHRNKLKQIDRQYWIGLAIIFTITLLGIICL